MKAQPFRFQHPIHIQLRMRTGAVDGHTKLHDTFSYDGAIHAV